MKRLLITLAIALGLLAPVAVAVPAMAATGDANQTSAQEEACKGIGGTYNGTTCSVGTSNVDPASIVKKIIEIFSWVVGAVAVIMVIFGGFRYVTSGGDNAKVTSAKNTILYALIGLIVVALSQVIVIFVFNKTNEVVKTTAITAQSTRA